MGSCFMHKVHHTELSREKQVTNMNLTGIFLAITPKLVVIHLSSNVT